ncbi:MAG: N-acetylmuramoyl-L-alanine amidase [Dermatophilaceae bacterium]|nr:peptidoglycan-binding domain-containing protein [Intrasporangiaceae bacterium]
MSDPTFLSRAELGMADPVSISRNITPENGGLAPHYGGAAQNVDTLDQAVAKWLAWQRFHMGRNHPRPQSNGRHWVDIAYNVGFWRGYVFAGRGYGVRSAAQGTNFGNQNFYAAVWLGGGDEEPTDEDYATLDWIILDARENGGAGTAVKPHSFFKSTRCPGKFLVAHARLRDGKFTLDAPNPEPAPKPEPDTWTESLVKNLPNRSRRTNLAIASNWDRRIQGLLAAAGRLEIAPNLDGRRFDGKFGSSTEKGVQSFQGAAGLVVDGIVGPNTWAKLLGR